MEVLDSSTEQAGRGRPARTRGAAPPLVQDPLFGKTLRHWAEACPTLCDAVVASKRGSSRKRVRSRAGIGWSNVSNERDRSLTVAALSKRACRAAREQADGCECTGYSSAAPKRPLLLRGHRHASRLEPWRRSGDAYLAGIGARLHDGQTHTVEDFL